jgi:predicted outer membrane lipoprotein
VTETLSWPDALFLGVLVVSVFGVVAWALWLSFRDERDDP